MSEFSKNTILYLGWVIRSAWFSLSFLQFYCCFGFTLTVPCLLLSDESGNWPTWEDVKNFGKAALAFICITADVITHPTKPLKRLHYSRNIFNKTDFTEEELGEPEPQNKAKFHQNNQIDNKPNRKYVVGEWCSSEVVFYSNGTINNTPEDRGTFNIYSGDNPVLNFTVHGIFDVLPYMFWGNAPNDTTTIIDRFIMIWEE